MRLEAVHRGVGLDTAGWSGLMGAAPSGAAWIFWSDAKEGGGVAGGEQGLGSADPGEAEEEVELERVRRHGVAAGMAARIDGEAATRIEVEVCRHCACECRAARCSGAAGRQHWARPRLGGGRG
jgi:hypothetical protein